MNGGKEESILWYSDQMNPIFYDSNTFFYISKVVAAVNCVSSPVSAVGNALVLMAIVTTRSIHNPSNILIAALAFADFLVGAVVQPMCIGFVTNRGLFLDYKYQDSLTFLGMISTSISVTLMGAVSCDRYIALFLPLRYNALVTNTRAIIAAVISWVFWLTIAISYVLGAREKYVVFLEQAAFIIGWIISSFVIGASYIKIIFLVRRHRRQIHHQQAAVSTVNANTISQTKLAITMGYVIGISVLCYLPTITVFQVFVTKSKPSFFLFNAFFLTMSIQLVSSSFNPVIYCWRRKEIRQAVIAMLRKLRWSC